MILADDVAVGLLGEGGETLLEIVVAPEEQAELLGVVERLGRLQFLDEPLQQDFPLLDKGGLAVAHGLFVGDTGDEDSRPPLDHGLAQQEERAVATEHREAPLLVGTLNQIDDILLDDLHDFVLSDVDTDAVGLLRFLWLLLLRLDRVLEVVHSYMFILDLIVSIIIEGC